MPDPNAASHAGQHDDFEVFYNDDNTGRIDSLQIADCPPGWYWWSCQPGCLPDSEPTGPFETSQAAWCDYKDEVDALQHERECSDRMEQGDY